MNRIDEIKARCEAATPGPWETEGAKLNRAVIGGKVELLNWVGDSLFYSKDDFAFIAAAREDIPFLLAMVDTLQAGQKMMESDQASAEMNLERLTAERDAAMRRAEAAEADLVLAMENSNSFMSCEPCVHRGYDPDDGLYCKLKSCKPKWRGPEPGGEGAE